MHAMGAVFEAMFSSVSFGGNGRRMGSGEATGSPASRLLRIGYETSWMAAWRWFVQMPRDLLRGFLLKDGGDHELQLRVRFASTRLLIGWKYW